MGQPAADLDEQSRVVLASCYDDDSGAGALIAYDGHTVELIDHLSCTGLAVSGGRLLRLLRTPPDITDSAGRLLVYDQRGLARYFRIDSLLDGHGIAPAGAAWLAVSTATNTLLWIDAAGNVSRSWTGAGTGDAWHVNDVLLKDGNVYLAAFGRYSSHREWTQRLRAPDGIIFDVATGADVVTGLSCPHTPRFFDGCWVVCNSGTQEVLQIDAATGEVRRRLHLHAWTRGMAVTERLFYTGLSANRHHLSERPGAAIAVVDRGSWEVMDEVPLPFPEVYELVIAPASLLEGLRSGSEEANELPPLSEGVVDLPPTAPLPVDDCRIRIEANVPPALTAGQRLELTCTVRNTGGQVFSPALPHPVRLTHLWAPAGEAGAPAVEGERHRLPGLLGPGETVRCTMAVTAPAVEGEYTLTLTALQEDVRWFQDVDPQSASSYVVWVTPTGSQRLPDQGS